MPQNSQTSKSALLTVMVFKDNLSTRTFRVPLRWITQFGWLLFLLFLITGTSTGLAVRYFLKSSSANRGNYLNSPKITELETQLKEAQARIATLAAKEVTPEASILPIVNPATVSQSSPLNSKPYLFKGLPDQIQAPPSEVAVPIAMTSPVVNWDEKYLKVKFNLEYVSSTPGGQQGRLFLIARGPGVLYTYPAEIIQSVGTDSLFNPNKGEYFSVSRFRETKASFGPISSKKLVNEVEVVVLSSNGQLLIHRKLSTNIQGVQKTGSETLAPEDNGNDSSDSGDTNDSTESNSPQNSKQSADTPGSSKVLPAGAHTPESSAGGSSQ